MRLPFLSQWRNSAAVPRSYWEKMPVEIRDLGGIPDHQINGKSPELQLQSRTRSVGIMSPAASEEASATVAWWLRSASPATENSIPSQQPQQLMSAWAFSCHYCRAPGWRGQPDPPHHPGPHAQSHRSPTIWPRLRLGTTTTFHAARVHDGQHGICTTQHAVGG